MISLVIPIYNEYQLIPELLDRSVQALAKTNESFEIICVDDGSTDQSMDLLLSYHQRDGRIKILALSRNFGLQAALTAGIEHALGDFVVMMDGDLQDPPEIIPEMYRKMHSGNFDIINGKRISRQEKGERRLLTRFFHFLFRRFSGLDNMADVGNFSMFNRNAINSLLSMKEKIRYLPGLRSFIGYRQGAVEYHRERRPAGKSKMSLRWLFSLAADAIYSFSKIPLKICLYLGVFGVIVFFCAGIYVLLAKIFGFAVVGWSSTLLSIYFLGSIQLTFLGVVGEYVFRIYKESQDRPLYLIKQFYSDESEGE
jgi:dolichol-phosphate mannosyltransferase